MNHKKKGVLYAGRLSTVNRWELNKVRPNMKAMRAIKKFCEENGFAYETIEAEWLASERVRQ